MSKLRIPACEIGLVALLAGGPAGAAAGADDAAPQEAADAAAPAAAARAADAAAATDPPAAEGEAGRGAAPAGAAAAPQTGPISGYMDFHINDAQYADPVLDFHRFVLLVSHRFSDRVHFVSEIELEHAVVSPETGGELELEQAYVDFRIARPFNLRAGMVLAPVGIINERHEPPVFHGVERPLVETVLIPTTWFGAGAGFHGELRGGFRYRAYAMETLDASRFSADEGLREGRQKGAESNARHVAGTGRLEYVGTPRLTLGASFWRGRTGFASPRVDSALTLAEIDGRYRVGEVGVRGLYAHAFLDGTGELNRTVQRTTGVSPNIAREMRGFYLEGSWFVVPRPAPREVAVFVRYENLDTQFRMAPGYESLPAFDRAAWIAGVTYFPDPDVAVKVDYTVVRSRSAVVDAPNSFNVGLGWWF
ncbi:MAG: porin [Acidobacteria bacterium]|nr:porin [Acidobacteriota bacterium]